MTTETKQALDAVLGLPAKWRHNRQEGAAELFDAGCNFSLTNCADDLAALLPALTAYIHRIQTSHPSYDNAVRIRQLEEQVEQLQAALGEAGKDSERLDWLADRDNPIGNVQLPTACVEANLHSLRAAIDTAMTMPADWPEIDAMAAGEGA